MIRVFLVDNHTILRQALRALLEGWSGLEWVGEAADGSTAVREVARIQPDVVLLGMTLPFLEGLEATRQIRQQCPNTQVLFLSSREEPESISQAFQSGARGFLLKGSSVSELVEALQTLGQGNPSGNPEVSPPLAPQGSSQNPAEAKLAALSHLTLRERQVLQLIADGYTNPLIARSLHVSVKTVETHRLHIMKKLNIHQVAGLVKFALRTGLTSLQ